MKESLSGSGRAIESAPAFFGRLNSLGNGERAALRRETGVRLQEADSAALAAFYRCLPSTVSRYDEDKWFAIACFRCLWDAGTDDGEPFEKIVAKLIRQGELSDSTRHRVETLLDTQWDADGYMLTKLSRLIKLVKQKSVNANVQFSELLRDLIYWNSDSQYVQRKWAREIFANITTIDETTIDEKE